MSPKGSCWKILLLLMCTLACWGQLSAAQIGEYFMEDTNVGKVDGGLEDLGPLLFWLKSDEGLRLSGNAEVLEWKDRSGRGNDFKALKRSKRKAEFIPAALHGKPAVRFFEMRQNASGLVSEPLKGFDVDRGLTMSVLMKTNGRPYNGYLLSTGYHYKVKGNLGMIVRGQDKPVGRSWWQCNMDSSMVWKATDDQLGGKGYVMLSISFDPVKNSLAMFQNELLLNRQVATAFIKPDLPFALGSTIKGEWGISADVVEVVAFNRALGDQQISQLSSMLLAKYDLGGKPVSSMAPMLPYAYYPSTSQLEVAMELNPEQMLYIKDKEREATVVLSRIKGSERKEICRRVLALNSQFRGQELFDIPELSDGDYEVRYLLGDHVIVSPEVLKRVHFPFEEISHGKTHRVFPPFTPIEVERHKAKVVGREYQWNGFGLLSSVKALDQELLAEPMALTGQRLDGRAVQWNLEKSQVRGQKLHDDEAVFKTQMDAPELKVTSEVTLQEDGMARVKMTLSPGEKMASLQSLKLRIPLRDEQASLFHVVADNGMRFNYGGKTPRGGQIKWYRESWDGWVPMRWKVEKAGSDEGVIWTSADTRQHNNQKKWDHRLFVPYVWLGSGARGLSFFMEREVGFEVLPRTPIQRLVREAGKVVLEVDLIQKPTAITSARTLEFGLMASPGKPAEPEFRTRPLASGVGPVVCWGGWQCSSKYPENHDWSIVDRIQDIRRRGEYTPEDRSFFEKKYEDIKTRWPDRKVNRSTDWLWITDHFAKRAALRGRTHSGIYFEEHATDRKLIEWEVFQDEWASHEFNRFRKKGAHWGVAVDSYHDFVLYMANEWMKRGVSLYFDNTNPKRSYNERFGVGYRSEDGALKYGISMFGQREYYRRIYKLLSLHNERGVEYPIDFTLHITNTNTLPFNTWATALLDLEQRSYTEDPKTSPPEITLSPDDKKFGSYAHKLKAFQLPWPSDYTRTVGAGLQTGTIPLALDFVSGHNRHISPIYTKEMMIRDWGMRRIHNVRPGPVYMKSAQWNKLYEAALQTYGYGDPAKAKVVHYWDPEPSIAVDHEDAKWLWLKNVDQERSSLGMLLLQGYNRGEDLEVPLRFASAVKLKEVRTESELTSDAEGVVKVPLGSPFGTAMFEVLPLD